MKMLLSLLAFILCAQAILGYELPHERGSFEISVGSDGVANGAICNNSEYQERYFIRAPQPYVFPDIKLGEHGGRRDNMANCVKKCKKMGEDCKSTIFYYKTKSCYYFKTVGKAQYRDKSVSAAVNIPREELCGPNMPIEGYVRRGDVFETSKVGSLGDCCAACLDTAGCKGYNYNEKTSECAFLKSYSKRLYKAKGSYSGHCCVPA